MNGHDPARNWFSQNEHTQNLGQIPEAGRMPKDISNGTKTHVWLLLVDGSRD